MSTTTSTTTATAAAPQSVVRNYKDSMKSTWRQGDRKDWTFFHWMYEWNGLHHVDLNQEVPVHQKNEKIPTVPEWQLHRWVLYHAFIPLGLHQLYCYITGSNLHPFVALLFYSMSFNLIGIHQLNLLRRLGHKWGFLDGDKHERDGVPDHSVRKVFQSLVATTTWRGIMAIILSYRRTEVPTDMNLWILPLEIGLYGIVLDFWFYWYHRVMHANEGLWKFHRTHHLTKHPNPLLTLYADTEQEIFDIVGIPLLAYGTLKLMGFPMGFYEYWVCHQYVVFAELSGHSGLRIHASPPSTLTWLLRMFDCELVIEDHDLHHRKGWKKSHNYGKQTRLWDRIFGTCCDRIESVPENVDTKQVNWPLY